MPLIFRSFTTTDPAPTTILFEIFTGKIVEFDPIITLFPILVFLNNFVLTKIRRTKISGLISKFSEMTDFVANVVFAAKQANGRVCNIHNLKNLR